MAGQVYLVVSMSCMASAEEHLFLFPLLNHGINKL